MKIDTFTKIVLTSIAVFLGCIAFDYKPNIRAEAQTAYSGKMIAPDANGGIWYMRGSGVRYCDRTKGILGHCS